MRGKLDVEEVVEFAVKIEQNGHRFYSEALKRLEDPAVVGLFEYLAEEEATHEQTFAELKKLGKKIPFRMPESYPGEYEVYMWDFLKTHALADLEKVNQRLAAMNGLDDAAQIALEFEKDSIVLFTMLREMVDDEKNRGTVDRIIAEEMTHIARIQATLHELKKP